MLTLDVQTNLAKGLAKFATLEARQFPFVVSTALNVTAQKVAAAQKAEMAADFKAPKPFTLNSLRVLFANKANLEAGVTFKDGLGGRSAGKYLDAQIKGGARRETGYERYFEGLGIIPAGMFAVPAQGLALDQYGNIPRSLLGQLIRGLKAAPPATKRRTSTKAKVFAISQAGGLPMGIYVREAKAIRMVIAFVKQPSYEKRFDFYGTGERVARAELPAALEAAIRKALATSR